MTVPGDDGDFGILASHVPTLTVLRPGVVTVTETQGGADKKFFGMLSCSMRVILGVCVCICIYR